MADHKADFEIEMGVINDGSCLLTFISVVVLSGIAVGIAFMLGGFSG